jgi:hypothetical protein
MTNAIVSTKSYDAILIRASTADGVTTEEFCDYPDAEITPFSLFIKGLKTMDDGKDMFALILPAGTDGEFETLDGEYGIH